MIRSISVLGSGWLGLPLVEHFVQSGYTAKASTRSENRLATIEQSKATAYIVDIENISNDIQNFLDSQILIINITSKNVQSFENLIKEIKLSPIEKVLLVSSTSVYKNLNRVVTEDEGAENENSILFQIENLFRVNTNFKTTIIRMSGLIGYSRHPGRWFANKAIPQPDAPVNLIHRDDCVGIINRVIEQDVWGEVFNACADSHPAKRDFYAYARSLLDSPDPEYAKSGELLYKIVSSEKLQDTLNYQLIYPDLMEIDFA